MFTLPEKLRKRNTPYSESGGVFETKRGNLEFFMIASSMLDWEHVSITVNQNRCPTWNEMCQVKDLFWEKEDVVIQYHPRESEYISNHPYCLHLWRLTDKAIPTPPMDLVGLKFLNK